MGTYKQVSIDADLDNRSTRKLATIQEIMRKHEAQDCWRGWCESTKWWPDDMIRELSKALPDVLFRIDLSGQASGTYYVFDGNEVDDEDIFPKPRFPTEKQFEYGKRRKVRRMALKEKEAAKKKKANEKQRLARLKQQRKNLNTEIQNLEG